MLAKELAVVKGTGTAAPARLAAASGAGNTVAGAAVLDAAAAAASGLTAGNPAAGATLAAKLAARGFEATRGAVIATLPAKGAGSTPAALAGRVVGGRLLGMLEETRPGGTEVSGGVSVGAAAPLAATSWGPVAGVAPARPMHTVGCVCERVWICMLACLKVSLIMSEL